MLFFAEDEWKSLTAWGEKLLCSLAVWQQILLYLLAKKWACILLYHLSACHVTFSQRNVVQEKIHYTWILYYTGFCDNFANYMGKCVSYTSSRKLTQNPVEQNSPHSTNACSIWDCCAPVLLVSLKFPKSQRDKSCGVEIRSTKMSATKTFWWNNKQFWWGKTKACFIMLSILHYMRASSLLTL